MKKVTVSIAVALACVASMAHAAPKENSWYVGSKLGWSQYHDTGFYGNSFPALTDGVSTRSNQLAAGVFGGYQANPYLGFEMGYDWLGRMAYKGAINNGALKAQGVQLAAKVDYPLTDSIDVYTRIGGMVWRADSSASYNGDRRSGHDTGVSPLFAGGVEWAITPALASRLEYQWINNIGDAESTGARPDNGQVSFGLSYRFGQETAPAPMPVSAPAPAPTPQVHTRHFTLKSDVLFGFNQSVLKPEGQQELDKLYNELSQIDPNEGSVTVLGYSDRIGSDAYNQPLSTRRAESVGQYLVNKGIPADKISARGMGKANPVTGNQCDGLKKRQALIACLAADRRVEIEVHGVKEETVTPAQ